MLVRNQHHPVSFSINNGCCVSIETTYHPPSLRWNSTAVTLYLWKLCLGLLLLCALTLSPITVQAATQGEQAGHTFYSQLHKSRAVPESSTESLLDKVFPEAQFREGILASPEHEDDLAFNYLWLQQHRDDYQHHDGGRALGKILRLGVKAFYNARYGDGSGNIDSADSDSFSKRFTNMDYRLRLNGDNLRIGIEYSF